MKGLERLSPSAHTATPSGSESVWRRYGEFLRRPPQITFEWWDEETEARGWLVINSLRGGAAGGGTRMRAGLTRREVVYLAKAMELKFVFSGPAIGGAKSGIDFDPTDRRREGVLRRWFDAIAPQLHACYGTGGDLNVDEVLDVIPGCERIGLSHPQEGVVRGHLRPPAAAVAGVFAALDQGIREPVTGDLGVPGQSLPLADLITGYGLAQSVIRLFELQGRPIAGTRVLLEGFGAVGGPCALYLARAGAVLVGISDREKALLAPEGLTQAEVEDLVRRREDKCLPQEARCRRGVEAASFRGVQAEVFIAAACSGSIDDEILHRLTRQGVDTIACGANQPFRESKLGATRVQRIADRHFTVIPDIVANCGMARAFSHLMHNPASADVSSVFQAVDETIASALRELTHRAGERPNGLLAATIGYALDHIGSR